MIAEAVGRSAAQSRRAVDAHVVAVGLDIGAQGAQASADAVDPVQFLVAQLARATDDGACRAAVAAARQRTGISSIAAAASAGLRSMAWRDGRADDEVGERLADAVEDPSARGRLLDDGAHRAQEVDDRAAGRIDADVVDDRSSAAGWIAPATSQKRRATSPGTCCSIARHACSSLDRSPHRAIGAHRSARQARPAPEHPLGVVARRDRLADRRLAFREEAREQERALHLRARDPDV